MISFSAIDYGLGVIGLWLGFVIGKRYDKLINWYKELEK